MNVLYHLTIPRPARPECEAVWQEIDLLRQQAGAPPERTWHTDLVYLNPSRHPLLRLPRPLYGLHRLYELRRREAAGEVDLHHLYNPDPYPFPVLRWLKRPLVYTLSAGLRGTRRPLGLTLRFFVKHVHTLVVSNQTDRDILASWGLTQAAVVRPGIDVSRFSHTPLPLGGQIRLMLGSAPWVKGQFRAKGIDALLDAAQARPTLRLTCLWRGTLYDEMVRRVQERRLEDRVEILNQWVDVNQVLAGVHASIVLTDKPAIVKAYPTSLLESLAAGKPVLVSRAVPLADYVERTGCGAIVEQVTVESILDAVESLKAGYEAMQTSARRVGKRDFDQQTMIDALYQVYRHILDQKS